MRKLIWLAGAAALLGSGGCCRWCDRWCGNNHCGSTGVQASPACVPCAPVQPAQCCPVPAAAPTCCPTPAASPPPPSSSWQRSPGY